MASGSGSNMFRPDGRRQKLARTEASLPDLVNSCDTLTSKLAKRLVYQWSWGHISAPEVQRYAECALVDLRDFSKRVDNFNRTFYNF